MPGFDKLPKRNHLCQIKNTVAVFRHRAGQRHGEICELDTEDEPLSKNDGLQLLNKLEKKLTKKELDQRKKQLSKAKRFIENVEGGIDAPLRQTFEDRKDRQTV